MYLVDQMKEKVKEKEGSPSPSCLLFWPMFLRFACRLSLKFIPPYLEASIGWVGLGWAGLGPDLLQLRLEAEAEASIADGKPTTTTIHSKTLTRYAWVLR